MFCLGYILCILEGDKRPSPSSIQKMTDRIRVRLKDAPPLEKLDYQIALTAAHGKDSKENTGRHQICNLSRLVLNTPGVSAKDSARAETQLGRHFGLPKIIYLVGVDYQVQHDGPTMIIEREKAISDFCEFLETKTP